MSLAEDQMNRKRGVQSRKQQLATIIAPLAVEAKSLTLLAAQIKKKGLSPYYRRGILQGIIDNNKKYRLRRLGVDISKIKELTQEELRLRDLRKLKEKNKHQRQR